MPKLTPEQEDLIFESISRQLSHVNKTIHGLFGQELSDEELRSAYQKVRQGVTQAMQQMERGNQGLPAAPRSRIEGDVRPSLGNSLINNLPAQPGGQQLMNPVLRGRPPMFPQAT